MYCFADDCDREGVSKGLCKKHYHRLIRHGDFNYVRPTPPSAKDRHDRWKQNNIEKDRERKATWAALNKDRRRVQAHERRVRENSKRFVILKKDIDRILSMSCFNCKSKTNITLDHIIPLHRGGSHGVGNLMALCGPCNSSKHTKLLIEWKGRASFRICDLNIAEVT